MDGTKECISARMNGFIHSDGFSYSISGICLPTRAARNESVLSFLSERRQHFEFLLEIQNLFFVLCFLLTNCRLLGIDAYNLLPNLSHRSDSSIFVSQSSTSSPPLRSGRQALEPSDSRAGAEPTTAMHHCHQERWSSYYRQKRLYVKWILTRSVSTLPSLKGSGQSTV